MNHQAPVVIAPTPNASSSIEPHETRVGSPSPRKLSVVSERIAIATVSVVFAKTIGITFGQHVPGHLVPAAGAEHPRPLEVGPLLDRQRLAPDQQRGGRPAGHADDEGDVEQRAAQHDGQDERQRQERDHQEPLGEPEQQPRRPALEEARDQADQGADHHRDRRREQADEQRDAGAPDQQREHRAAVVVGAEPELPRRRLRARRRSPWSPRARRRRPAAGEQRDQHEDAQDDQADQAGPVAAEQRPVAPPARPPAGGGRSGRRRARRRRSRGASLMSAPAGRGGRRRGWRRGWPRSPPPRPAGTCPAAPSSRGSQSASYDSSPRPGIEKIVSIVMAPETTKPMLSATSVVVGSSALRTACRRRTSHVAQTLGPGRHQVVLAELVEQRGPHDQRVLGEVGQGERETGSVRCQAVSSIPLSDARVGVDRSAARRSGRCRGTARSRPRSAAIRSSPSHHSGIE